LKKKIKSVKFKSNETHNISDNMTRFDDILGNEKEEDNTRKLKIILDEGDNIIDSISQAMMENELIKARLDTINGHLLQGTIIDDKTGQKVEVKDKEIISAGGTFSLTAGDLWGTLSIFLDKVKPITGKLVNGTAKEDTIMLFSFENKDIKQSRKN
jgi:hypothetical protein